MTSDKDQTPRRALRAVEDLPQVPDEALGDVAARPTAVCSHGHAGYCADDALPGERRAVDFLHTHAHEWAMKVTGDRDVAEAYACWLIADSWKPGVVVMDGNHRHDWERFKASRAAADFDL